MNPINNKASACMLAELMVKRRFHNIQLPPKFWSNPAYKRYYVREMQLAYGLLKLYDIEVICKALNTKDGSKIYSLCAKWLDPILQMEKQTAEKKEALREMEIKDFGPLPKLPINPGGETEPLTMHGCRLHNNSEPPGKKSIADKLKDL